MLSPNGDAITTQLSSDYAVNNYLMAWGHSLLNTNLYPLSPKPAWFDRVSTALTKAKTSTETWLIDDFPDIAAALPQSLIDYGNSFTATVDVIKPMLAAATVTAADRATIQAHVAELQKEAKQQQWAVLGLQKKVVAFSDLAASTATQMASEVKEVMKTLGTRQKELVALQNRIQELQVKLGVTTTEAKNSMRSAAMSGATVSMTIVSFAAMTAISTASVPVFGIAGAIIAIGVNAAMEAARSAEMVEIIREIGALTLKLSAEQYQVAGLQAINASLERLSDVAATSLTNMAGIVHHWDDIVSDLDAAMEILAQPAVDLKQFKAFNSIASAAQSWNTIIERANKIQASVMGVEKPIMIKGDAA